MFAFVLETYRRCFPAQHPLSHHCRGTADTSALTSCVTSPLHDLPHHGAPFSLQLLDLAHRWSEREDNDIHIFDVLPLATTVYIQIKLNSAWAADPDPFPDPQQPARPSADLQTAFARVLASRQPHNAPSLHTAWTNQQIVTEGCRTLGTINYELGSYTPAGWIHVFKLLEVLRGNGLSQGFVQSRVGKCRPRYRELLRVFLRALCDKISKTARHHCGVFTVRKKNRDQRIIIDARIPNTAFEARDLVALATGQSFAWISVDTKDPIFVGGVDLQVAFTPRDDHHLNKDDFDVVGEVALVFEWIVLKCLHDARSGLLDVLWDFYRTRKGSHTVEQWKRPCDPRLARLTKYIRFH